MAVNWPGDVPGYADSWSEEDVDVVLRTENEAGPVKMRLRYTGISTKVQLTMGMTLAQFDALRRFFRVDLRRGTVPFLFQDPTAGYAVKEFRMMKPPVSSNDGPLGVRVSMEWERKGA